MFNILFIFEFVLTVKHKALIECTQQELSPV